MKTGGSTRQTPTDRTMTEQRGRDGSKPPTRHRPDGAKSESPQGGEGAKGGGWGCRAPKRAHVGGHERAAALRGCGGFPRVRRDRVGRAVQGVRGIPPR